MKENQASQSAKVLVVTLNGMSDPRIDEFIKRLSPNQEIVYASAYNMPDKPPEGTRKIWLNCSPAYYLRETAKNYAGLPVNRFLWRRTGEIVNFRTELSLEDCLM